MPEARSISQGVGIFAVFLHALTQSGKRHPIESFHYHPAIRRVSNFIKQNLKVLVRNTVQTQGRMAQFCNTVPEQGNVFCNKMRMITITHFQLINRLTGNSGQEHLPRALQRIVEALQTVYALLYSDTRPRSTSKGRHAGKLRESMEGTVFIHCLLIHRFLLQQ